MARYYFVNESHNFIMTGRQGLLYTAAPSDTVYNLSQGGKPAYVLDLGKHTTPPAFYKHDFRDIVEFFEAAEKEGYVSGASNLAKNDKCLLVSYVWDKAFFWTIKTFDENACRTVSRIKDDFHFAASMPLDAFNMSYVMDDGYLYFVLAPDDFLTLCSGEVKDANVSDLIKRYGITEQSNPLIVKCRLK